jgi:hypothetical protein
MGGSMWKHEGNLRKNPRKTLGRPWKTLRKHPRRNGENSRKNLENWKTNWKLQIIQMVGHFQQGSTNITNGLGVTPKKNEKHISTTTPKKRWG